MATLEQIAEALKRADAAGDVAAARQLAQAYKAQQAQEQGAVSPGPRPLPNVDQQAQQSPGAFGNNPMATDTPGGAGPEFVPGYKPGAYGGVMDMLDAAGSSAISNIPIAGPFMANGLNNLAATVQGTTPEEIAKRKAVEQQQFPGPAMAGGIAGATAPYAVAGAFAPAARFLGLAGADLPAGASLGTKAMDLITRSGAAFGTNLGIGATDSMVRGASPLDALQQNLMPSAIVGSLPLAGATVRGAGRVAAKGADWLSGGAGTMLRNMRNPAKAAENIVAKSYGTDLVNGSAMSPALDAAASASGQPIVNLDRGGSVTRSLARTASNVSNDAEAALKGATDRGPASVRAQDFLENLVGGNANDLQLRQGIRNTAKMVNQPAYRKAYSSPAAASIWSPDLAQLMHAPEFQSAVREAEATGRTSVALHGGKPVQNPFVFNADGSVTMKPGVTPTLEFWDKVQQNLRTQAEALGPKERSKLADLTALREKLVGTLDTAVPEFKTARQGAFGFFQAEDALDAGRKFARMRGQVPEATAAVKKMNPNDQKAFGIGWASEQIDKLGNKDSYAAIKQTFENPNSREIAKLALGPAKYAKLEAFLKVEAIMNFSSDALRGNSTTAKQLAAMGAGGLAAGGYGAATGDWRPLTFATVMVAGRAGMRYLGHTTEDKVMTEVAKLLSSGSKADLQRVVNNAQMSTRWQKALNAVFMGIGETARGTVNQTMKVPALN